MHRLFWKIFLSFWAALILFAGAAMLTASHYLEQARLENVAVSPRARLLSHVSDAQRIAQRDGVNGLKAWLREIDRREPIPLFLLDRNGADLLGRPLPLGIAERLARETMRPGHGPMGPRLRLEIRLPDDTEYRLIADYQGVTLGRVLDRPQVIALPLILAALVSGLVCFLLARYLTAPLGRLRRATEAYAAGDLGARVAPTLGTRKDEVADLAHAFDRMAQRLQELMASQRQLLSDVSHELRSPLARLQVALGLARQRVAGQADAEFDRIEHEAERLNDLIGQLLSLAKLEASVAPSTREPVDLAELLTSIASDADYEARASRRRVAITRSEPAVIQGEARLLHSALENIVRNAVRYTPEDSSVNLSLDRDRGKPDSWRIVIHDQGPGVPQEMLPRLFEPFVRVGTARDRTSGGYGLGLAIAQKAVRLHDGEVSALNDPAGGFRVVITLPVSPFPA
jgi:two-component system, OmpR family, sensor histidine kinase CpxA